MVKKDKAFEPQLEVVEQRAGSVVALTNEAKLSLYKKSQKSGISTDILEEVYRRGYTIWNESFNGTAEQFGFDRVNSFISGGFAMQLDEDLIEDWSDSKHKNPSGGLKKSGVDAYNRENPGHHLKMAVTTKPSKLKPGSKSANRRKSFCARMGGMKKRLTSSKTANDPDSRINKSLRKWNCEETQIDEKRGLWDNIHAKRERIKHGSGEHMRKPGAKGAPTAAALKNSQNEAFETSEKQSKNKKNSSSRFDGSKSVKKIYQHDTPGEPGSVAESHYQIVKRVLNEIAVRDASGEMKTLKNVKFRGSDNKVRSAPPAPSGSHSGDE